MRPLDQELTVQTIAAGPPGRQGAPGTDGKQGLRGRQGILGGKGDAGNQVIGIEGPPTQGVGNNGDLAIDLVSFDIYGPKANGQWGQGRNYKGDMPAHQWTGTSLSFENPDGSFGAAVNLKSTTAGPSGGPIPAGGQPGQVPTPLQGGGYGWSDLPGSLGTYDGGEY